MPLKNYGLDSVKDKIKVIPKKEIFDKFWFRCRSRCLQWFKYLALCINWSSTLHSLCFLLLPPAILFNAFLIDIRTIKYAKPRIRNTISGIVPIYESFKSLNSHYKIIQYGYSKQIYFASANVLPLNANFFFGLIHGLCPNY